MISQEALLSETSEVTNTNLNISVAKLRGSNIYLRTNKNSSSGYGKDLDAHLVDWFSKFLFF